MASPILTRLYTPDDFGILSIYLFLIILSTCVATFKFEMAIFSPRGEISVLNICRLAIATSSVISSLILVFVTLTGGFSSTHINSGLPAQVYYILPIALFLSSNVVILSQALIRQSKYIGLAWTKILQNLMAAIFSIVLALIAVPTGLVFSHVIGLAVACCLLLKFYPTVLGKKAFLKLPLWSVAKKYYKYPLYMVPSGILNILATNIPLVIISSSFGLAAAGYFGLAQRTLHAPATMIGNAVGDVFRQQASKDLRDGGSCRLLMIKMTSGLLAISAIPFVSLYYWVVDLFPVVFGSEWTVAGEMAQVLLPMYLIRFVTIPCCSVLVIVGKTEVDLCWQLFFAAFSMAGIFFMDDWMSLLNYYSFAFSVLYIIIYFLNFYYAGKAVRFDNGDRI